MDNHTPHLLIAVQFIPELYDGTAWFTVSARSNITQCYIEHNSDEGRI